MEGCFQEVVIFKKHLDSRAQMLFISKGKKLNGNPLGLQVTAYSPLDRRISI